MTITVYTKPMCVQCDATKRALTKQGVEFATIDLSEDAGALDFVRSLGHMQAPVVMAGDEHWSGYRPDLIKKVARQLAAVVNG